MNRRVAATKKNGKRARKKTRPREHAIVEQMAVNSVCVWMWNIQHALIVRKLFPWVLFFCVIPVRWFFLCIISFFPSYVLHIHSLPIHHWNYANWTSYYEHLVCTMNSITRKIWLSNIFKREDEEKIKRRTRQMRIHNSRKLDGHWIDDIARKEKTNDNVGIACKSHHFSMN